MVYIKKIFLLFIVCLSSISYASQQELATPENIQKKLAWFRSMLKVTDRITMLYSRMAREASMQAQISQLQEFVDLFDNTQDPTQHMMISLECSKTHAYGCVWNFCGPALDSAAICSYSLRRRPFIMESLLAVIRDRTNLKQHNKQRPNFVGELDPLFNDRNLLSTLHELYKENDLLDRKTIEDNTNVEGVSKFNWITPQECAFPSLQKNGREEPFHALKYEYDQLNNTVSIHGLLFILN
jgi:hypothetical protein